MMRMMKNRRTLTFISDILAELDLPRSGIQDIREVPYPKGYIEPMNYSTWDNTETQVMGYYSGQIHIRNQLNDIQKDLYAPESMYPVHLTGISDQRS